MENIFKKVNDFNQSYKKLVSEKDKHWSSFINYHSSIPNIYIYIYI